MTGGHRHGSSDEHDSAGVPWSGREFRPNPNAEDDGSADPVLALALAARAAGDQDPVAVVDALRTARLLVPLLAEAGTVGRTASGRIVDKSQELSIVKVAGPDGAPVLPAFSSVDAMRAWNPDARPIPTDARLVMLAAGGDGELVVLDPGSRHVLPLSWEMMAAIATGDPYP